ncbi:complex I subunit 1 family protein [Arthrobacter sp. VKM Ac-2550]|uniref:complex I subunit 1 family protein n=1 Tax=Crystallibacter permensis TaxID=1938888 RepID=UPI002225F31E|nr:complex I subunit 1 family protein [Arthrobacter sp. VKM Ac-2550]MCW2134128.1 NADH dehydrogenase subunit H [Arthrobacter sp. VKM Ac-2550]
MPENMPETLLTTVPAGWAVLAGMILCALAFFAAALDSALSARAEGAGRGGWLAPAWSTARLLRQRRRTVVAADTLLLRVGAAGMLGGSFLMVAVIPFGRWTLADLDVGVVWFNTVDVMVWALVWLAGWGANSVHGLVGGYRFLAHGLAYELPLMFALVAPAIAAGSLRVSDVAGAQDRLWFAVWMPVAFVIFLVGVTGFSVWGPFAAALGADVAGGVLAELSGVDRLVLQAGRYAFLAAGAAFSVPLFLGGGAGPFLPEWAWVVVKTVAVLAVLVWLRRKLPVFRPDRFLEIGWVVLLPAAVAQDLVVSLVVVWKG